MYVLRLSYLAEAVFWLISSLLRFFGYFWSNRSNEGNTPKTHKPNRSNAGIRPKISLAKYSANLSSRTINRVITLWFPIQNLKSKSTLKSRPIQFSVFSPENKYFLPEKWALLDVFYSIDLIKQQINVGFLR